MASTSPPEVIPLRKKLNFIWWFGNEFDPIESEPQMWPGRPLWQRRILWALRNPMENFNRYVIGVLDRAPECIGDIPDNNFRWPSGWKHHRVHPTVGDFASKLYLPFVSYNGSWQIYAGWKHDGPVRLRLPAQLRLVNHNPERIAIMSVTPPADTKPWYASVTIWGSILAIAAPVASLVFKLNVDAQTTSDMANWLAGAGALVGGLIAIWGRLRATTAIAPSK